MNVIETIKMTCEVQKSELKTEPTIEDVDIKHDPLSKAWELCIYYEIRDQTPRLWYLRY